MNEGESNAVQQPSHLADSHRDVPSRSTTQANPHGPGAGTSGSDDPRGSVGHDGTSGVVPVTQKEIEYGVRYPSGVILSTGRVNPRRSVETARRLGIDAKVVFRDPFDWKILKRKAAKK